MGDGTNFLEKGGLGAVESSFETGVVLVMSMWDDHYANMLWLDSTYPVDSSDPGAARGPCPTTSGDPKDVESSQGSAKVTFSDIKFGNTARPLQVRRHPRQPQAHHLRRHPRAQ